MVSIIMPVIIKTGKMNVYDGSRWTLKTQFHFTKDCIESIERNSKDYELIIIADKVIPEAREWLSERSTVIDYGGGRFNFAKAINKGIRSASGDYLLIMNNDTLVCEDGWLEKMRGVLDEQRIGAVSPYVNDGASGNPEMQESSFVKDFDFIKIGTPLNMICLMLRRSVYDEIGELDEDFTTYGGEDVDYNLRLVRAGYDIAVADVKLIHLKAKGWENTDISYGDKLFKEKWGMSLKKNDMLINLYEVKPIISVIMATYNQSGFIEEAIRSVKAQSFKNWELLIGNDGSTDETSRILEKYGKSRRIKIFDLSHQGFGKTVNFLLDKAEGEYICTFSSDDVMYTDSLKTRIENIDGSDIVHGTVEVYDEDLTTKGKTLGKPFDFDAMIKEGNYIAQDCSLTSRQCFIEVGKYDPSVERVLDYEWYLRAHRAGKKFKFINKPILKYRQHASNTSFGSKLANEHQNEVRRRFSP